MNTDKFIFINNNSLSKELCNEIIDMFNIEKQNNSTYDGITSSGINKNRKDTTDFVITNAVEWKNIRKCLETELIFNLEKYAKLIN